MHHLYYMRPKGNHAIHKFGIAKDLSSRRRSLKNDIPDGQGDKMELISFIECNNKRESGDFEKLVREYYDDFRLYPSNDWFKITGFDHETGIDVLPPSELFQSLNELPNNWYRRIHLMGLIYEHKKQYRSYRSRLAKSKNKGLFMRREKPRFRYYPNKYEYDS